MTRRMISGVRDGSPPYGSASPENRVYNPLDRGNLGRSVADALLISPAVPLEGIGRFKGAGIYALYYSGGHIAYAEISKRNRGGRFMAPIYVGKAVPAGARKGHIGEGVDPGFVLSKRLQEHETSVVEAQLHPKSTLRIEDFHCRYLIVEDIWIPLGESLLIARFSPLWNKLLDGFGNHDPGAGRYEGLSPRWDLLHPGRAWAEKCKRRIETASALEAEVLAYLRTANLPVV